MLYWHNKLCFLHFFTVEIIVALKKYLTHNFDIEDAELISVIDELPLWSAPFGLKLLDTIRLKQNINALDIGCGLGFPVIELAQRLGESSRVFGIDPWEGAIERSLFKIRKYQINNVKIIKGVAEELPFEDSFFDLIVSNNGINNVQNMERALWECARVSKPNTQLVLTLNLEDTMIEFYQVFEQVLKENNLNNEIIKMKEQIYSKRKPLSEIKVLLKSVGFKVIKIKHDKFYLRFVDATTMFNHLLIKYWFLSGWKSILDNAHLEKIFNEAESKLNDNAKEKGEIQLTVPFVTIDCVKV
jgi:arsenite methyltransferase